MLGDVPQDKSLDFATDANDATNIVSPDTGGVGFFVGLFVAVWQMALSFCQLLLLLPVLVVFFVVGMAILLAVI